MHFLAKSCGIENTVCVFEAIKETLFGFTMTHVSTSYFSEMVYEMKLSIRELGGTQGLRSYRWFKGHWL
jgi:hypothetical protein